jgi:hypothetical protein
MSSSWISATLRLIPQPSSVCGMQSGSNIEKALDISIGHLAKEARFMVFLEAKL